MSVLAINGAGSASRLNYAQNLIESFPESGFDINDVFNNVDESFWRFDSELEGEIEFSPSDIGSTALRTTVLSEA